MRKWTRKDGKEVEDTGIGRGGGDGVERQRRKSWKIEKRDAERGNARKDGGVRG